MPAYGYVTYPGVETVLSFDFTDLSGISPARAILEIMPQDEIPAAEGNLVLNYVDDNIGFFDITIEDCRIDAANYVKNSGGKVVRLNIMDERWKWAFGEISGRYNFKQARCYDSAFASGAAVDFVDPNHEKDPQELAKLLIEAMGYSDSDWDYSVLPTEPRPPIDWVAANPAQELAKLADQFGCRIVPVRSKGSWLIAQTGEGADLPENYPYQDPGEGIDPVESPDYLKIVTAETLYECRLQLEPVGKDMDMLYYELTDLAYCPVVSTSQSPQGIPTFNYCTEDFSDIDNERFPLDDDTLVSWRELAQQTVYKTFKLNGASDAIKGGKTNYVIPGFDDDCDIQQIILTENRVLATVTGGSTTVMPLRAYVEGTFFNAIKGGYGNFPLGTRLDISLLGERYQDYDDVSISFSLSNSEDVRAALLSFGSTVTSSQIIPSRAGSPSLVMKSIMCPPELYLHTAIKIRDSDTWQPVRDERYRYIGDGEEPDEGPDADGVITRTIIKNDIQPWYRGIYLTDGTLVDTKNNQELVDKQCNAYLDDLEQIYEVRLNARRTYIGLFPIDMDGSIQQVSYKIGPQGYDTVASQNSEHDFELPTYDDRRAREARKSPENREARTYEITDELRQRGAL